MSWLWRQVAHKLWGRHFFEAKSRYDNSQSVSWNLAQVRCSVCGLPALKQFR
jgi:hypothetical protein